MHSISITLTDICSISRKGTDSKYSHRVNITRSYLTSGQRHEKSQNIFYKTLRTEYTLKGLVKSVNSCATYVTLKKTQIWP